MIIGTTIQFLHACQCGNVFWTEHVGAQGEPSDMDDALLEAATWRCPRCNAMAQASVDLSQTQTEGET